MVDFLTYGWPINYTACTRPVSSSRNHPSALNFDSHVQAYIDTELSYNAIAGPFNSPPFADDFVCSPLQTVPKRGSSTRRVVMDLSFPQGSSVNDGIPSNTYLGDQFKLRLPGIDRLVEFILAKGRNCLVFKKDLRRAYRQFPVDPNHNYTCRRVKWGDHGMGPMQHWLTTATPFKSQKILFKARALGSNLIHRRLKYISASNIRPALPSYMIYFISLPSSHPLWASTTPELREVLRYTYF